MATPEIILTTQAEEWFSRNQVEYVPWYRHPSSTTEYDIVFSSDKDNPLQCGDLIGKSNFSVVRMKHKYSGAVYAVKQMFIRPGNGQGSMNQIQEEVGHLRKLSHFHVVKSYGSFSAVTTRGTQYGLLLEEAICDLALVLADFERADPTVQTLQKIWMADLERFLPSITGCLARGLAYIHKENIRHKDIKPENILFDAKHRRVMLADFGISMAFATVSGSTGPTLKTQKYAPPEILEEAYHGRPQDVFSLGCVFAEVFTVYKKRQVMELHNRLIENKYGKSIELVSQWMHADVSSRCDAQFFHLVRSMLSKDPKARPTAEKAWMETTIIASGRDKSVHFCGACCMPTYSMEGGANTTEQPDPSDYGEHVPSGGSVRDDFGPDTAFETVYPAGDPPAFDWSRNLRVFDRSILDVVRTGGLTNLICRKRVWPQKESLQGIEEARLASKAEADLLRELKHRHIIQIKGTYRCGNCFALMIMPVADFELEYYLSLAEHEENLKDFGTTLREMFGCLSSAVQYIHGQGIVHGEIKPRNILISNDRVYLAEFGFASVQKRRLSIQHTFRGPGEDEEESHQRNEYQAPEVLPPQRANKPPTADIFSLGCVFLEVETVRRGRKLQESRDFKASHQIGEWEQWMNELGVENHETAATFYQVLRRMVAHDAKSRPSSTDVLGIMRSCHDKHGKRLCGRQCEV